MNNYLHLPICNEQRTNPQAGALSLAYQPVREQKCPSVLTEAAIMSVREQ